MSNDSADTPELARLRFAALMLARTPEAVEGLLALVPVPVELLKTDLLGLIGENPNGEAYTLTDEAALRIELVSAAKRQVNGAEGDQPPPMVVMPLDDFLERDYPPPDPLLGDTEGVLYLARSTFLLMYGDGGAGKSTATLDAVAHLAAGKDWLGIPVHRPTKVLLIENEGAASLFQHKLAAKKADWETAIRWSENVFVYTEPWSHFSFSDSTMRETLRALISIFDIDLIVANPLFGIGGPGSGKPEDTSLFVEWLREIGLWNGGPACWLLHHENKLGQVSGDWARQPDTVIALEQDGDAPRTKLTWEKVRWVGELPEGWQRKLLLEWETSHKGYSVMEVDLHGATDAELYGRLDTYLAEHPGSATKTTIEEVEGNKHRLRELLKMGAEQGRYASERGERGAICYYLPNDAPIDLGI